MMRIGIYEGGFSPPHKGHVAAAKAFMEQMWLDFLYVVPLPLEDTSISASDRLEMCRLAFSDAEGICVSDMALCEGNSWSTTRFLRELSGEDRRLFLLLGTDTMLSLEENPSVDEIFALSYPTYVRREKDAFIDRIIPQKMSTYQTKYGKIVRRIVTETLEISSGEIRSRLQRGEEVTDRLPLTVEKYIADKHLYG
ncbi:MAG: hypothetical protein IIW36_03995 [Clostridia bacterium]|nr:hypothetical protein [Clostridia bacterium]